MLHQKFKATAFFALLFAAFFSFDAAAISAQTEDVAKLREQARVLFERNNYAEALPILEKIAVAAPDDAANQFYLGFSLMAKTKTAASQEEARQLLIRSRKAFVKAKQLGLEDERLETFIESIPEDGAFGVAKFSKNAEADRLMQEAEAAFTQGKQDEALKKYQKALTLDPKLYFAALFSGDMYLQKGDFPNAEIWYQKAIQIDPDIETAYRYSATPLMKQKKYDQARDRYVEAYITDPFNRLTAAGLNQWAQATGATLGHPKIEIPTNYSADEKGNSKITLDADSMLNGNKEDGSSAWLVYGVTRANWQKEFTKKYPNEKVYRHSLAEEFDALQSVIKMATADKKVKTLSPSLVKLKELSDKGLLEPYILLALTDKGIYQDYAEYRKTNRDKLRRYVSEYVLTGGGK